MVAIDDDGVRQPWERQPRESETTHSYFLAYRDMGYEHRSLRELAKACGKSIGNMEVHSSRWKWQDRVKAWDLYQLRARDAASLMRRDEMIERHGRAANNLLLTAQKIISPPDIDPKTKRLLTDAERKAWRPSGLSLQAATGALDKAIHHQRLAAGLPTDITRQDIMVRQQLQEAIEVNKTLIRLLEEHACDECKPGIVRELDRLAERNATAQGFLEAGSAVTGGLVGQ